MLVLHKLISTVTLQALDVLGVTPTPNPHVFKECVMEVSEYKLGACWLMVTGTDGKSLNVKTEALTLSLEQDVYDLYSTRGGIGKKHRVPGSTVNGPKKFNIPFETYSDLMVTFNGQGINSTESFAITDGSSSLTDYTVMQLLEEINKKQKLAAAIAAQR